MVVASGRRPAIDASMGRWLCDDALLDKELHAVHGGVLELGDQTGTGVAAFGGLGSVRWLAAIDAGRLAWCADGKRAASDLHLSGILRGGLGFAGGLGGHTCHHASDTISRSLWQRFGPEIDGLHGAVAHGFRRLLWRAAKQFDCGLLFHARIVNMFTAS